jgi:hypothetical protein
VRPGDRVPNRIVVGDGCPPVSTAPPLRRLTDESHLALSWVITDENATYVTDLRNGALNHHTVETALPETTTFTLTPSALIGLVTGTIDLTTATTEGTVAVEGGPEDLQRLVGLLAPVDPDFAIVTPSSAHLKRDPTRRGGWHLARGVSLLLGFRPRGQTGWRTARGDPRSTNVSARPPASGKSAS